MLDKVMFSAYMAYFKFKQKIKELGQEEDGMQTLETVVLIVIAVIIGGALLEFLTGGADGDGGLISKLFTAIGDKINELFGIDVS